MAFDSWAQDFCLACDRQVQTDGAAYCSEACRLAESEKTTSTPGSQASSPGFSPPSHPWLSQSRPTRSTKFYLSPAYDFTNAQPYGSTPVRQSLQRSNLTVAAPEHPRPSEPSRSLTPSSSSSSLCSVHSTSSSGEANQLSDKARKELQAYAVSFEQVRMQRRRSY